MYQAQYWVELQALKAHVCYLSLYQLRSESYERWIGIILAVASSSSIAGWVIWQQYAFVWACFIAGSQVISVTYKFLPFKERIKPLRSAGIELGLLSDEAERCWFDVAEGELTEKQINEKRFEIRKRKSAIMQSAFNGMVIPEVESLMAKAEDHMRRYFKSHYPELSND
jgi:hypothetical protein